MKYPIEQGFIEVDHENELHYEVYGKKEGKPLIVVNDFFSSKGIWARYFDKFADNYKLIIYCLRNQNSNGVNKFSAVDMSMDDHVADLAYLITRLGVECPIIIGVSTSTLICKKFALAHPELLSALILISPFFSPFGEARKNILLKNWITALDYGGIDFFFRVLYAETLACRTILEGQDISFLAQRATFASVNSKEKLKKFLELAVEYNVNVEELRKINARTLLVSGEQDFLNSPSAIKILGNLLPDAETFIVDFCNHMPYFESKNVFEKGVINFIDRLN